MKLMLFMKLPQDHRLPLPKQQIIGFWKSLFRDIRPLTQKKHYLQKEKWKAQRNYRHNGKIINCAKYNLAKQQTPHIINESV